MTSRGILDPNISKIRDTQNKYGSRYIWHLDHLLNAPANYSIHLFVVVFPIIMPCHLPCQHVTSSMLHHDLHSQCNKSLAIWI